MAISLSAVIVFIVAQVFPLGIKTDCTAKGEVTLVGSSRELRQENRLADMCHLSRIRDKQNLRWFIQEGLLVSMSDGVNEFYEISPDLAEADPDNPELYLYVRPWTKMFIEELSERMWKELAVRMRITSLVRHEEYQRQLRAFNSNAARESTHPTGATVDISLSELTWGQKRWLRKALLSFEQDGLVEATEERSNHCMHVFVHPRYGSKEDVFQKNVPTDHAKKIIPTSSNDENFQRGW